MLAPEPVTGPSACPDYVRFIALCKTGGLGHKRKFNTSNMQSLERLLHIAKQALETDYRSWGDSCV
jgi:hypothetical protein